MLLTIGVSAQGTTDEQLAAHYYREGDFEKALLYYEALYEKRASEENYQYFLTTLLNTENFKDALKLAERHSKAHPQAYRFRVDIGRVMKRSGDYAKAEKHFNRLIKDLDKASVNQILDVGNSFAEMGENDLALEAFYQGRKQMGEAHPFNFQIAQILGQQGDVEGMINEYLDVLEIQKGYIQSVQNTLNRVIGFEEDNKYNDVLLTELQRRIQKNPNDEIYAEMLIWIYMKQNKYELALLQVKALDKRNKEDGERVIDMANLALNNHKYDVAIDGFSYVKNKGPKTYYYQDATSGVLTAMKAQVTEGIYTEESIEKLIGTYQAALEELGYNAKSALVINEFAQVKAFYQSKFNNSAIGDAVGLLNDALSYPGLSDISAAQLKINLADIYVLSNSIWDASLLYGQVEKKFKYDELGHQAKLKNALVFYYAGDFKWSQSQLDVLKGSTSKLISNDAVELSSFISENLGIDSNMEALSMFSKMELMIAQHKYDSALAQLDSISTAFPGHELGDNILFKQGEIYAALGEYTKSEAAYLKIPEIYPYDILVDNAIMQAALINEIHLKNTEKAMSLYEQILKDHSGSLFVVEARKRFRNLRGDTLQ